MKYCSSCGRNTLHLQQKDGTAMNLVNVILVVMTLGLWLIVWGLRQFFLPLRFPPQCSVCGKSSRLIGNPGGNISNPAADKLPWVKQENLPRTQQTPTTEDHIRCPFCAELIRPEARICRFCQRDLPEQETSAEFQTSANHQGDLPSGSREQPMERMPLSQSDVPLLTSKRVVLVAIATFLIALWAINAFNNEDNAPQSNVSTQNREVGSESSAARQVGGGLDSGTAKPGASPSRSGFLSFEQEKNRITQAIQCQSPKITPPSYGLGDLFGCVSGPAKTVKVFINEAPGTGGVENVKIMWNDWFRDGGWGVHADQAEARRVTEAILKLYDPAQSKRLITAFFADSNATVSGSTFKFKYTRQRGPKIDERLIAITENSAVEQVATKNNKQMVLEIQSGLNSLGYDAGPADGLLGPRTRNAIEAFQRSQKIGANGNPSANLLARIESAKTSQITASRRSKAADSDMSVTSAYKVCSTFDGTGITSETCKVSGWDQSVNVRINMVPSEARSLCGQVARKARDLGWDFQSGWKLKIYSPYSGDNTIAFCNL
jgi:hypothetical protein